MKNNKTVIGLLIGLLVLVLVTAGVLIYNKVTTPDYSNVPNPTVTITMESGDVINLELFPAIAPNTVANFVELAESGYYDGLIFHRVLPGKLIQGGDPMGNGTGGPGYCIKGEFTANGFQNDISHTRGVISMARSSAFDSAGSQFFIMESDVTSLDHQYAAFGKVTDEESLTTIDKIGTTAVDSNDKPLTEWRIKTITVDTKGYTYKAVKLNK